MVIVLRLEAAALWQEVQANLIHEEIHMRTHQAILQEEEEARREAVHQEAHQEVVCQVEEARQEAVHQAEVRGFRGRRGPPRCRGMAA
jgi:hypothetical protein